MGEKLRYFLITGFLLALPSWAFSQDCPPEVTISMSEAEIFCQGQSVSFSADAPGEGALSFRWYLNGEVVGTEREFTTDDFNTENHIYVIASHGDTCEVQSEVLSFQAVPAVGNIKIQATQTSICPGETVGFSIETSTPLGGSDFRWEVNGAVKSQSNAFNSDGLQEGDKVQLLVEPGLACQSPFESNIITISVTQGPPGKPAEIIGAAELCARETSTYTTTAVAGAAQYIWSLPGGWSGSSLSNTIQVQSGITGGVISVRSKNACGLSDKTTFNVVVKPSLRGTIQGPTSVCPGSTVEYSVTAVEGIPEYNWQLPEGWEGASSTNSITVVSGTSGGNIVVSAQDTCRGVTELELAVSISEGIHISEILTTEAGGSQVLNCGFTIASLHAEVQPASGETTLPGEVKGQWSVISGQPEDSFELSNPFGQTTEFKALAGVYQLEWRTSSPEFCGEVTDTISVEITDCGKLGFDGEDAYISTASSYNEASAWEVWVRPSADSGTIFSNREETGTGYALKLEEGKPLFFWNSSALLSPFSIKTNDRWYHLAVSLEGNTATLYIDGVAVETVSGSSSTESLQPLLIGAEYGNLSPEAHYEGWMEELRIWDAPIGEEQIRFLMNQRLSKDPAGIGKEIPMNLSFLLPYSNLSGYYQLMVNSVTDGFTPDLSDKNGRGRLFNMEAEQENSAPLPYLSIKDGEWSDPLTWSSSENFGFPSSVAVTGDPIEWNIVRTAHDISSGPKDITVLGLISVSGEITIADPIGLQDETNNGQMLQIKRYLKLDGSIDLTGESQLLQGPGSIVDESSTGFLERDQQGTASSYHYNYWSSPVSPSPGNAAYSISEVVKDGTDALVAPLEIDFGNSFSFADGEYSNPRKISNYWLHGFKGTASSYGEWKHVGSTGDILVGEGFSMKGTSGSAAVTDKQNYTFNGIPNNGDFSLTISQNQNYLIGNPYPSALDARQFILDNLTIGGNSTNVFNGTLYFWDHFDGGSHYVSEYIGGYATYNLSGSTPAISNDERLNNNLDENGEYLKGDNPPGRYIPVGQAFFVSTITDSGTGNPDLSGNISGGEILFRNSQRVFQREEEEVSVFKQQATDTKQQTVSADPRQKIWLQFTSPTGIDRQLLITADTLASNNFDLGYDAPLIEDLPEDMYWYFSNTAFVIQGVTQFNEEQEFALGIKIKEEGDFTIGIDELLNVPWELEIYLKDNLREKYHNLKEGDYVSDASPGTYNDRFSLVFKAPEEVAPEEEKTYQEEDEEEVFEEETPENIEVMFLSARREIKILNPELVDITQIHLYNLRGQRVESYPGTTNQRELKLSVPSMDSGMYVIRVFSAGGLVTKKILLN